MQTARTATLRGPWAAQTDAVLVGAAREGDREAFAALVARHQRRVRMYIGSAVARPDVVDDLAQDVFISAFASLSEFKPDAPLSPWLLGIARHKLLMYLRSEGRRQRREGALLDAVFTPWWLQQMEEDEPRLARADDELAALERCLAELPPTSAAMVIGHHLEGRRVGEVASELGKSETSVRMALLRVRRALRDCVQRRLAREGRP